MRPFLCCLLAAALCAGEADPLAALPAAMPRPVAATLAAPPFPPAEGIALGAGVRMVAGQRVVLDGTVQVDRGPSDGLEVLACLRDGKTHESLVRLETRDGAVVKAACLAAFGWGDGRPPSEGQGVPGRGVPVRLQALWRDDDGWHLIDASSLIRDRRTDRPFPPLPWVFTGSRTLVIAQNGPNGQVERRERFMLDITKSVAVNYDEPDALLASPFPCAEDDTRFEVNTAVCPPAGTVVHLVLTPVRLPLVLDLGQGGALVRDGATLDDGALAAALLAAYPAGEAVRAVLVRVPAAVADAEVVAARVRLLAAAAAAPVWCVPVFE